MLNNWMLDVNKDGIFEVVFMYLVFVGIRC